MSDFYSVVKSLWVVWMLLLFVGIVVWVLLPRNRARFRKAAKIPFAGDDDPGERKDRKNDNFGKPNAGAK